MLRPQLFILLALALTVGSAVGGEPRCRLPVLTNEQAWGRLPGSPERAERLPAWARALAGPMPLTTARMLELDTLHRAGDRLDARLRALARWAAADANGCDYAKAMAAADFARAGGGGTGPEALVKDPTRLPALDRAAVAFARKMMREANAVTDAEVKELLDLAGEERVMALVALVAHASFQDRILLALGLPPEPGGGPPPVAARFGRPMPTATTTAHAPAAAPTTTAGAAPESDGRWLRLRDDLDQQRKRTSRIRVPSREEVLARIGADHPAAWQAGIVWSRVAYGYQPELTDAWFDCAGAFRREANLDPVFQNSIFWVVTDALRCFY